MKERKAAANWYIAATHYLTAGFVVPIVGSLIAALPIIFIVTLPYGPIILITYLAVTTLLIVWLGVMYSSKYLNKTYIIRDANKIILLSTLYLVIIRGIVVVYDFTKTGGVTMGLIISILGIIAFYLASKKYVKNNV